MLRGNEMDRLKRKLNRANHLQEADHVMESLLYYEEIIGMAKENSELYYKARIWRALAIARTKDPYCLSELCLLYKQCAEIGLPDLSALACLFYYGSLYFLKYCPKDSELLCELYEYINKNGKDYYLVQADAVCKLLNLPQQNSESEDFFTGLLKIKRIRGFVEVIDEYYEKNKEEVRGDIAGEVHLWIQKNVKPVMELQQEYREKMLKVVKKLDDKPFVYDVSCAGCDAKCCHDGVYMDKDEVKRIRAFVRKYKSEFMDLPQNYIIKVPSMYEGLPDEIKTLAVKYEHKCDDYPEHFNKTKCVFADEDGFCRLQKVATRHLLHPYHAKPRVCWAFPLEDIRMAMLSGPPASQEDDIFYFGDEYPGYMSCLECLMHHPEGVSWKIQNIRSIEYYRLMRRRKQMITKEYVKKRRSGCT